MAYKVCGNCNEENPENSSVCSSCSHPLHNAKIYGIPSSEKQVAAPKVKYCSNCNERLVSGSFTCKYCGHMAVSDPSNRNYSYPNYSTPASDNSGAIILLFIATFFIPLVGLIVGGIYALDNDPDKSSVGKGLIIFGLVMIMVGAIIWGIFL